MARKLELDLEAARLCRINEVVYLNDDLKKLKPYYMSPRYSLLQELPFFSSKIQDAFLLEEEVISLNLTREYTLHLAEVLKVESISLGSASLFSFTNASPEARTRAFISLMRQRVKKKVS